MKVRRSEERGATKIGWLDSRHTFSFGEYYDPNFSGFRSLRVINDDRVAPGAGFGTHGHRDMEIISIVLSGALSHRDNLGHVETLKPGEVQVMTAGKGIEHSEFNQSDKEAVHFLQIWIIPEGRGLTPRYSQKYFNEDDRRNTFLRVAGPKLELDDGALHIHQDAHVFLSQIEEGGKIHKPLSPGRGAWIHVIEGTPIIGGTVLSPGDSASFDSNESGTDSISLESTGGISEIILFDLK